MKTMVMGITRSLASSENNLHTGIMTYASIPHPITQGFRNFNSEEDFKRVLDSTPKTTDPISRVDLALHAAKREFFSPKGGMRHGHPKYLIFLASSNPTAGFEDLGSASLGLEEAGVKIISIGMSSAVDETFLKNLASDYWFMLEHSSPEKVVEDVSSKLCHGEWVEPIVKT